MISGNTPASFWKHVDDLRTTLIKMSFVVLLGVGFSFFFYKEILNFLISPSTIIQQGLYVLGPLDGFLTALKTSFWVGLVTTSPIWLYFLMSFISPALQANERKWIIPFIFLSLVFCAAGLTFSYYMTIPIANQFLSSFNSEVGINMWTLSSYLDYTLILLLSNALAFELTVILLFLVHYGALSAEFLSNKRRHSIVLIFILAAILTPPDIFTQFMLAIPLMVLYELTILYARLKKIN